MQWVEKISRTNKYDALEETLRSCEESQWRNIKYKGRDKWSFSQI